MSCHNGPFAASGHMVHAGGQASHWDIYWPISILELELCLFATGICSRDETNRTLATWSSDFVNHSYDYRPNWAPLSPITIMCSQIAIQPATTTSGPSRA